MKPAMSAKKTSLTIGNERNEKLAATHSHQLSNKAINQQRTGTMGKKVCDWLISTVIGLLSIQECFESVNGCHHGITFLFVILHSQQAIPNLFGLNVSKIKREKCR